MYRRQLSKNYLTSITDDDATVTAVLEQLTYVYALLLYTLESEPLAMW